MRSARTSDQQRGFALVLTLSLLALLVILAYTISSVSKVDSLITQSAGSQRRARQNALLGLHQALAQLQQLAGPDQRTTATGSIRRAADSGTDQDPLKDVDARKFWTGVWDQNGNKLAWLVSGKQSDDTAAVVDDLPDHPAVQLVGPGTLGTGTTMVGSYVFVQADPVKITTPEATNRLSGHYGYWVGDEGVKISAEIFDAIDQIEYANGADQWASHHTDLRQMLLSRPYLENIFGSLVTKGVTPFDVGVQDGLQRIIESDQLALVTSKASGGTVFSSGLKQNFFNVTPLASNVFADPVRGGLKQDLSSPSVASALLTSAQKGWFDTRPDSTPVGGLADYKVTAGTNGISIAPILTEFQIRFGFKRDTTTGNLTIKTQMQAELWNPYNANLHMEDSTCKVEFKIKGLPTRVALDFKAAQPSVTNINLQRHVDTQKFILGSDDQLNIFAPGQITTVSGGSELNAGNSSAGVVANYLDDTGNPVNIANGSPKAMTIRDDDPADKSILLQVDLLVNGTVVASYAPEVTFQTAATVDQDSFNTLAATKYTYGWGFALHDDLAQWSDGTVSGAADPRGNNLNGTAGTRYDTVTANPAFSLQAADNASRSISTATSAGVFTQGHTGDYVLFELPQRSVLSIGQLQHAVSEINAPPFKIGNPWGGDANALFDRVYISGLPSVYAGWSGQTLSQLKSIPTNQPITNGATPLPNSFLALPTASAQTDQASLLDGTKNANYLMQAGGFNVNSTSPDAWLALLNGNEISEWPYRGPSGTVKTRDMSHAYFHFPQSGSYSNYFDTGFSTTTSGSSTSRYVQGARDIPESSMTTFAREVVRQIRAHDRPYLSLQDFLNDGAIDRAIAAANLNGTTGVRGSPYFLSQADVVTLLAPALANRSDTFRIRGYGDAVNPATGEIEARAYCEAIVQRTPAVLSATLGRKFVVTYFRWLGPNDI